MQLQIHSLALQCRQARELIDFSPQVSFFHGKISAGKSSIVRLIDFSFGGDLVRTPAINRELVSVELSARIGRFDVLLERTVGSNQVQVSWRLSANDEAFTVLAPLDVVADAAPIWGENIFNLSDLMFFFFDVTPMKVRRSKIKEGSPLVRLSFRDIFWYCYVKQDFLDSSFYNLEDPHKGRKSRDVMRFTVGYYTEKLNDSEIRLDEVTRERASVLGAAARLRDVLGELGFDNVESVEEDIKRAESELEAVKNEKREIGGPSETAPHLTDKLKGRLRELSVQLSDESEVLIDLKNRIDEEESLKSELMTAKFKLARTSAASSVLSGVGFTSCPSCGTAVTPVSDADFCGLCQRCPTQSDDQPMVQTEVIKRDLVSRIDELVFSVARHKRALKRQEESVVEVIREKRILDERLRDEMATYDSIFLAGARDIERRIAITEEKLRNLSRLKRMPASIADLEGEADFLVGEEERIKRIIQEERDSLTNAEQNIRFIEDAFLDALLTVGVPGVIQGDEVSIDRRTWIPYVLPGGDAALRYSFYEAGSGGKKTLFNVCYALAVHRVSAERSLPLPNVLIIDTPMKNIGEEVNEDIFKAFYEYLYGLAVNSLGCSSFKTTGLTRNDAAFGDRAA